ncbi:MAG: hypothetical protein ACI4WR_07135 [Bulleidia sp.]
MMTVCRSDIIAIDPGSTESGVVITTSLLYPVFHAKVPNDDVFRIIRDQVAKSSSVCAIEMIASYGMPVGREVFDTCIWIGRFVQYCKTIGLEPEFVLRQQEKLTICHSPKANDATIKQALVDRFASGVPNHGKGTKKDPGWFYGFKADEWSAYAVAVTYHDLNISED